MQTGSGLFQKGPAKNFLNRGAAKLRALIRHFASLNATFPRPGEGERCAMLRMGLEWDGFR